MKKWFTVMVSLVLLIQLTGCNIFNKALREAVANDEELQENLEWLYDQLENMQNEDAGEQGLLEYTLGDVTLFYPAKASLSEDSQGEAVITRLDDGSCQAVFTKSTSEMFTTSYTAAYYTQLSLEPDEEAEIEDLLLDGSEWGTFTLDYPEQGANLHLYVYSTGYDMYILSIRVPYGADDSLLQTLLEGMQVDTSEREQSHAAAVEQLAGEWDLGMDGGCMVFEADGAFAWYQSRDKDPDNVFTGTYFAQDRIPTRMAGYAEGIYVEVYYTSNTIGGEQADVSYAYAYAFEPAEDGSYTVHNLDNGGSFAGTVKLA